MLHDSRPRVGTPMRRLVEKAMAWQLTGLVQTRLAGTECLELLHVAVSR
jgi:hypothetical protein